MVQLKQFHVTRVFYSFRKKKKSESQSDAITNYLDYRNQAEVIVNNYNKINLKQVKWSKT